MILDDQSATYQVTMASGQTHEIAGDELVTEGGALAIRYADGSLVVAFGPGAWLEVQRA